MLSTRVNFSVDYSF